MERVAPATRHADPKIKLSMVKDRSGSTEMRPRFHKMPPAILHLIPPFGEIEPANIDFSNSCSPNADRRSSKSPYSPPRPPRLRRMAMARGGRRRASFEQSVKIRDAIVAQSSDVQELMREQLRGVRAAALEVLRKIMG